MKRCSLCRYNGPRRDWVSDWAPFLASAWDFHILLRVLHSYKRVFAAVSFSPDSQLEFAPQVSGGPWSGSDLEELRPLLSVENGKVGAKSD